MPISYLPPGIDTITARLLALSVILLFGLQGCALTAEEGEVYPDVKPEPVYDQLYPYYVEACAVSQIRANFAEPGGTPGHAVMFLKGACIDRSRGYPRLKLCDPDTVNLDDPESGTGISVNKTFKNVNWIAIPGKKLFFHGILDQGVVNEKAVLDTLDAVEEAGAWDGIEIHEQYYPQSDDPDDLTLLAAQETLGTDFALRFGRYVYCARVPMPRQQLGRVVDYLNGLNDEYAIGVADYNWSGYSDNCSHAIHNSLANANVWKDQKVNTTKFRQLFNLSVPANEVINLALLANTFPLEKFDEIYYDETKRRALLNDDWLPTRHGALVKYLTIHRDNELYDTGESILVLELPFFRNKSNRFSKLFGQPRYTEVEENLLYFQGRYQQILDDRPFNRADPAPGDPYGQARKHYYEYIEAQLADVNRKLAQLTESRPGTTRPLTLR